MDSVAGWGLKPTARYARALARARGWTYLALEDGFLRSVGLGESGAPPVSLVVDDLGVYYDARQASRLEQIVASGAASRPDLLSRARSLIDLIVKERLSKTNASSPMPPDVLPRTARTRLLVLDQTFADASIEGGLAGPASFRAMLEAARQEGPATEVLVRRHPAVAAGLKRGCLPDDLLAGCRIVADDVRLPDLLQRVDAVYTVSSLGGFEALMRGLPVRCFGAPFYAGWGLTEDEVPIPRRVRRVSIEELFAAAYILYARYVDPLFGRPCEIEHAIERLLDFRRRSDDLAGYTACIGFAPWKHGSTRTLIYSPRGETGFFVRPEKATAEAGRRHGRVIFWGGRETSRLAARLSRSAAPVSRMEDGFIRSRGLGSDFYRPASVVLDDRGVYYDARGPSRLEDLLQAGAFPETDLRRAAELRRRLVQAKLSKYNLGGAPPPRPPREDSFALLAVGQVEDDRSIVLGCADVRTNLGLLQAARQAFPDAFIVYKPHPDVEAGNRRGAAARSDVLALADAIASHSDIDACLGACDAVATMTSLAGFEALLRGKPVWTFGRPFYGGWGLTHDALDFPRRTRALTLDELVAGTLIAYPLYVDPVSGLPCRPEDVLERLASAPPPRPRQRRIRYLRALIESLRTSPVARY